MQINELANQTGVSTKTIRYYESIGLMPLPKRAAYSYRQYGMADGERLRFIASARSLGFSIDDVRDILAVRDSGEAPCQRVLDTLDQRIRNTERRIAGLVALRDTLCELRREGEGMPLDDVRGEHCVCYLLKTYHDSGHVSIEREDRGDV